MDSALFECEDEVKELAAVFLVGWLVAWLVSIGGPFTKSFVQVELSDVPELIKSNELYDPCTLMLYYKGRHVLVDIGTGPSTKITLAPRNQGDLVTVLKNAFDAAKMGLLLLLLLRWVVVAVEKDALNLSIHYV